MPEKPRGRGNLLKRSSRLHAEAKVAKVQAQELRHEHRRRSSQLQPKINSLKEGADMLAPQFKQLYEQASEAYSNREGALAKALSLQGKALQAECESLNAEANALRAELHQLHTQCTALYERAERLVKQAETCMREASELRQTLVDVDASSILTNQQLEEYFDEFPQAVFRRVNQVKYDVNLVWRSHRRGIQVASRGRTSWDAHGRAAVVIGRQPGRDREEQEEKFKEAVAHELGHIVYKHFLSDEHQAEWFCRHAETPEERYITREAWEGEEEDFAECFRIFHQRPEVLKLQDPDKFGFIKEIYEELNKWPS